MRTKILFVTTAGERSVEGFSYALELAKTLDSAIAALLLYRKSFSCSFTDAMASIAFSEEAEYEEAERILNEEPDEIREEKTALLDKIAEEFGDLSGRVSVHSSSEGLNAAIKSFLSRNRGIELVLLSPCIASVSDIKRDAKKFLKSIERPVVILGKPGEIGNN